MTKRLSKNPSANWTSKFPVSQIIHTLDQWNKSICFLSLFSLFFNRGRTIPLIRPSLLSIVDSIVIGAQLGNERTDQLFLGHYCHFKKTLPNLATYK